TFIGISAGNFGTTGTANTASGSSALLQNTTGASNTASGAGALYANSTGTYNTASGGYALQSNTTGRLHSHAVRCMLPARREVDSGNSGRKAFYGTPAGWIVESDSNHKRGRYGYRESKRGCLARPSLGLCHPARVARHQYVHALRREIPYRTPELGGCGRETFRRQRLADVDRAFM